MEISAHSEALVLKRIPLISAVELLPLSVVLNCSELAVQLSLSWVLNSHSGTHQCSSRALTSWQHSTAPQSVTVCPFWLESVCQPFNPDRSVPSLSRSLPASLKALAQTKCSMVTHHPGPLTQHSEISYCLKVLIYFPQKWGRKERESRWGRTF